MTALLFVVAICLAGAVILVRRLRLRRRVQHNAALMGRNPEQPLTVQRYNEIDEYVAITRCLCGSPVTYLSEAGRQTPHGSVRVVHCECASCGDELDLFFLLERVLH